MLVQYMILFKRTLRLKQGNFSHLIQLHSFSLKNTYEMKKKVCSGQQIRNLKQNWQVFINISLTQSY
jgi:hypothetical protein